MAIARPGNPARQRNWRTPVYPSFEWFFALPHGIRRAAVAQLKLPPGGAVLDVGCGSGRNFRYLESAVGATGRLAGIDRSETLLSRAHARVGRHSWKNVELILGDMLDYASSVLYDAALFSVSYTTMEQRRDVLARVWSHVKPGGRIVVMDARTPPGPVGRILGASLRRLGSPAVAMDPDLRPWDDLRALGAEVQTEDWAFGSYFIATGVKPTS